MTDQSETKAKLARLLVTADPMRIYFADIDNADEYDAEAEDLARRLPAWTSRDDCFVAVEEVFFKYFGDLIRSRSIDFNSLADGLWTLRNDFQR